MTGFHKRMTIRKRIEEKNSINLQPSLGAGIPFKLWDRQYAQIDYALDLGSVGEGLSHLFSFSFQLK